MLLSRSRDPIAPAAGREPSRAGYPGCRLRPVKYRPAEADKFPSSIVAPLSGSVLALQLIEAALQ